jgi:acylphosphatase
MVKVRVHVFIEGYVQGVFFRANTRNVAQRLGITGWVRNLPDGRVEAVFEGDEEKVKKMIEWCWRGPPGAEVTNVDVISEEYKGEFDDFRIIYY